MKPGQGPVVTRASVPVVGIALLLAATVAAGGVVAAGVFTVTPAEPPPQASLGLSVDADADRVALTHRGGDPLDVRELTVRVEVDGDPLARQPPVPFFAAAGFRGGPTGPFNPAADQTWDPGEAASFRIAATNDPELTPGATVVVSVYHDDRHVAELEATA